MPDLLIGLIVAVLLVCLAYWAIHRIAAAFGLPAQIVVLLDVVIVVVFVVYLLRVLGWWRL
jgi:hypothetical protein